MGCKKCVGTCQCLIEAGQAIGVTVTGVGSSTSPYVITFDWCPTIPIEFQIDQDPRTDLPTDYLLAKDAQGNCVRLRPTLDVGVGSVTFDPSTGDVVIYSTDGRFWDFNIGVWSETTTTLVYDAPSATFTYNAEEINEVQYIEVTGDPTGGTFTLSYDGQGPTGALDYNATAEEIYDELILLSNIGSADINVFDWYKGGTLAAVYVWFQGALAGQNVPQITANGAGLTGGTSPDAVVTTSKQGSDGVDQLVLPVCDMFGDIPDSIFGNVPGDRALLFDGSACKLYPVEELGTPSGTDVRSLQGYNTLSVQFDTLNPTTSVVLSADLRHDTLPSEWDKTPLPLPPGGGLDIHAGTGWPVRVGGGVVVDASASGVPETTWPAHVGIPGATCAVTTTSEKIMRGVDGRLYHEPPHGNQLFQQQLGASYDLTGVGSYVYASAIVDVTTTNTVACGRNIVGMPVMGANHAVVSGTVAGEQNRYAVRASADLAPWVESMGAETVLYFAEPQGGTAQQLVQARWDMTTIAYLGTHRLKVNMGGLRQSGSGTTGIAGSTFLRELWHTA